MKGNIQVEEDGFWSKGAFVESVDPNDSGKMRTFHMSHDEEMDYLCRKCKSKISAHNKDWHDEMCDKCFNGGVF